MSKRGGKQASKRAPGDQATGQKRARRKTGGAAKKTRMASKGSPTIAPAPQAQPAKAAQKPAAAAGSARQADDVEVPSMMGSQLRRAARRMVSVVVAPVAFARAVVDMLRRDHA